MAQHERHQVAEQQLAESDEDEWYATLPLTQMQARAKSDNQETAGVCMNRAPPSNGRPLSASAQVSAFRHMTFHQHPIFKLHQGLQDHVTAPADCISQQRHQAESGTAPGSGTVQLPAHQHVLPEHRPHHQAQHVPQHAAGPPHQADVCDSEDEEEWKQAELIAAQRGRELAKFACSPSPTARRHRSPLAGRLASPTASKAGTQQGHASQVATAGAYEKPSAGISSDVNQQQPEQRLSHKLSEQALLHDRQHPGPAQLQAPHTHSAAAASGAQRDGQQAAHASCAQPHIMLRPPVSAPSNLQQHLQPQQLSTMTLPPWRQQQQQVQQVQQQGEPPGPAVLPHTAHSAQHHPAQQQQQQVQQQGEPPGPATLPHKAHNAQHQQHPVPQQQQQQQHGHQCQVRLQHHHPHYHAQHQQYQHQDQHQQQQQQQHMSLQRQGSSGSYGAPHGAAFSMLQRQHSGDRSSGTAAQHMVQERLQPVTGQPHPQHVPFGATNSQDTCVTGFGGMPQPGLQRQSSGGVQTTAEGARTVPHALQHREQRCPFPSCPGVYSHCGAALVWQPVHRPGWPPRGLWVCSLRSECGFSYWPHEPLDHPQLCLEMASPTTFKVMAYPGAEDEVNAAGGLQAVLQRTGINLSKAIPCITRGALSAVAVATAGDALAVKHSGNICQQGQGKNQGQGQMHGQGQGQMQGQGQGHMQGQGQGQSQGRGHMQGQGQTHSQGTSAGSHAGAHTCGGGAARGHGNDDQDYVVFPLEVYEQVEERLRAWRRNLLVRGSTIPAATLRAYRGTLRPVLPQQDVEAQMHRMPAALRAALMPFQLQGVRFGLERHGRVLVADEMGVGKTVQAIALASCYQDEWPLLAIVPASMRLVWAEELEKWLPHIRPAQVHVIEGKAQRLAPDSADPVEARRQLPLITVTSYEMMRRLTCDNCCSGPIMGAGGGHDLRRLPCTNPQHCMASLPWGVVIIDESHNLRTTNTRLQDAPHTEACCNAASRSPHAIMLTGTPSLTRPYDLFRQVDTLRPGLLGHTKEEFAERYCERRLIPTTIAGQDTRRKWFNSGGSHLYELHYVLRQEVMIRRLKREVLGQLPPKRRAVIRLPHPPPARWPGGKEVVDYEDSSEEEEAAVALLAADDNAGDPLANGSGGRSSGMGGGSRPSRTTATDDPARMSKERRTALAKLPDVLEWLASALEGSAGSSADRMPRDTPHAASTTEDTAPAKFLLFAHHRDVMDALASELLTCKVKNPGGSNGEGEEKQSERVGIPFVRVDGTHTSEERREAVRQFKESPHIRVALLSITAAAVGLDFSSASVVVFVELPYEVALVRQAEDRAHRKGTTKAVNVYFLVAKGTSDDHRWQRLNNSLMAITQVQDGPQGPESGAAALVPTAALANRSELGAGVPSAPGSYGAEGSRGLQVDQVFELQAKRVSAAASGAAARGGEARISGADTFSKAVGNCTAGADKCGTAADRCTAVEENCGTALNECGRAAEGCGAAIGMGLTTKADDGFLQEQHSLVRLDSDASLQPVAEPACEERADQPVAKPACEERADQPAAAPACEERADQSVAEPACEQRTDQQVTPQHKRGSGSSPAVVTDIDVIDLCSPSPAADMKPANSKQPSGRRGRKRTAATPADDDDIKGARLLDDDGDAGDARSKRARKKPRSAERSSAPAWGHAVALHGRQAGPAGGSSLNADQAEQTAQHVQRGDRPGAANMEKQRHGSDGAGAAVTVGDETGQGAEPMLQVWFEVSPNTGRLHIHLSADGSRPLGLNLPMESLYTQSALASTTAQVVAGYLSCVPALRKAVDAVLPLLLPYVKPAPSPGMTQQPASQQYQLGDENQIYQELLKAAEQAEQRVRQQPSDNAMAVQGRDTAAAGATGAVQQGPQLDADADVVEDQHTQQPSLHAGVVHFIPSAAPAAILAAHTPGFMGPSGLIAIGPLVMQMQPAVRTSTLTAPRPESHAVLLPDSQTAPLSDSKAPAVMPAAAPAAADVQLQVQLLKEHQLKELLVEASQFAKEWRELRAVTKSRLQAKVLTSSIQDAVDVANAEAMASGAFGSSTARYIQDAAQSLPPGAEWRTVQVRMERMRAVDPKTAKVQMFTRNKSNCAAQVVQLPVAVHEYQQAFTLDGQHRLCLLCSKVVPNAPPPGAVLRSVSGLFCSPGCEDKYWIKASSGAIRRSLAKLEKGICVMCGQDCRRLVLALQAIRHGSQDWEARRKAVLQAWFPRLLQRNYLQLGQRLLEQAVEGNAWNADHIIPVYKGGGLCELDNLRTLCVACHADVTRAQAKERKEQRMREALACQDIRVFLSPSGAVREEGPVGLPPAPAAKAGKARRAPKPKAAVAHAGSSSVHVDLLQRAAVQIAQSEAGSTAAEPKPGRGKGRAGGSGRGAGSGRGKRGKGKDVPIPERLSVLTDSDSNVQRQLEGTGPSLQEGYLGQARGSASVSGEVVEVKASGTETSEVDAAGVGGSSTAIASTGMAHRSTRDALLAKLESRRQGNKRAARAMSVEGNSKDEDAPETKRLAVPKSDVPSNPSKQQLKPCLLLKADGEQGDRCDDRDREGAPEQVPDVAHAATSTRLKSMLQHMSRPANVTVGAVEATALLPGKALATDNSAAAGLQADNERNILPSQVVHSVLLSDSSDED